MRHADRYAWMLLAFASSACTRQGFATVLDGSFPETAPRFSVEVRNVLVTKNCWGCHMTATYDPVIGLMNDNSAVVSYYTSTHTTECATTTYVVPGNPDASYLYQKITGQGSCFTGAPMPLGSGPLDPDVSAIIGDWITAGARDD